MTPDRIRLLNAVQNGELRGPAGNQGPKGDTGPKGDQGPKGPQGDRAEGILISASDPKPGHLADKLKPGDGIRFRREVSTNGDRFVIASTRPDKGPKGDRGPKGDKGDRGPVGPSGGGGGGGGGDSHPGLGAHEVMGLATDADLAAHAELDALIPVYIQETEPAPAVFLWVNTTDDTLWYHDGVIA